MKRDPIIEEVRKAGENLAREAGYDVHTFFNMLRERENSHAARVVSRTPVIFADNISNVNAAVCAENPSEYERKR
ncbi:MAG: hypothetical protein WCL71_16550 [Deltaproteobacteria bacterium]